MQIREVIHACEAAKLAAGHLLQVPLHRRDVLVPFLLRLRRHDRMRLAGVLIPHAEFVGRETVLFY